MTLAYVFWHWPDRPEGYEERMQTFHDALGCRGSTTFRLARAPWDEDGAPYEDWYPVRDWAAVGELNDRAVSGARRGPHDAVAGRSRRGTGAILRLLEGDLPLRDVRFAAWSAQRPEAPGDDAMVWQRQLVLGPAPEYALLAASPLRVDAGAVLTNPRGVAGA